MKIEVSSPTEMLQLILWIAGAGTYRLVPFKKEKIKTKYAIVRVLPQKFVLIKVLSTPRGAEKFLEQSWEKLRSTYLHVSFYHLENGDIRVWL